QLLEVMKLYIKREDLLHPYASGNKFRKLKYNLLESGSQGYGTMLTLGGAYSNHISGASYAAKAFGLRSIGVIRGEELRDKISENPPLRFAHANGMRFEC